MAGRRRVALFDLDHTLIPFDSGLAWSRFLMQRGHLPVDFEERYLAYGREYVLGRMNIRDLHRCAVAPLGAFPMEQLEAWRHEFAITLPPRMPPGALALVGHHAKRGDLCAIVTATTRFISEPFAQALQVPHLISTEAEVLQGRFTGEVAGEPCFRDGKIAHVRRWLETQQLAPGDLEHGWFYSDSINDLPLLAAVGHPVAVMPDPRLREHARARAWHVLETLDDAARLHAAG